jgi:hypothetical protein
MLFHLDERRILRHERQSDSRRDTEQSRIAEGTKEPDGGDDDDHSTSGSCRSGGSAADLSRGTAAASGHATVTDVRRAPHRRRCPAGRRARQTVGPPAPSMPATGDNAHLPLAFASGRDTMPSGRRWPGRPIRMGQGGVADARDAEGMRTGWRAHRMAADPGVIPPHAGSRARMVAYGDSHVERRRSMRRVALVTFALVAWLVPAPKCSPSP